MKMHYRSTSQFNHLLAKDDVGKPKDYVKRLPSVDFAYGKFNTPDDFNVKACKLFI